MDNPVQNYDNQSIPIPAKKKINPKLVIGIACGGIALVLALVFAIMAIGSTAEASAYHSAILEQADQIAADQDCSKILCLVIEDKEETYSKEYVPEKLLAQNAREAAIVLRLTKGKVQTGKYENGAKAYQYQYSVQWLDYRLNKEVLKKTTFLGGFPPVQTTGGGVSQYGSKPKAEEITKWIEETYDELFENPTVEVVMDGFHLVLPNSYTLNEEGDYTNGTALVSCFSGAKTKAAEVGINSLEQHIDYYMELFKSSEGFYNVSSKKATPNNTPYFDYRYSKKKTVTENLYGVETERERDFYTRGIVVFYETETEYWTVCYELELSLYLWEDTAERAVENFLFLSTLCSVSRD